MSTSYATINATITGSSGSYSLGESIISDCNLSVVVVQNSTTDRLDDVVLMGRKGNSKTGTPIAYDIKTLGPDARITSAIDDDVDVVDVYAEASVSDDGSVAGTFVGSFAVAQTYRTFTVSDAGGGALVGSLAQVYVSTSGQISVVNSTGSPLTATVGGRSSSVSSRGTSFPASGGDTLTVTSAGGTVSVTIYDTAGNTATISSSASASDSAEALRSMAQPYVITPDSDGEIVLTSESSDPVCAHLLGNSAQPVDPTLPLDANDAKRSWYLKWDIGSPVSPTDEGDATEDWKDPKIIVKRPVNIAG